MAGLIAAAPAGAATITVNTTSDETTLGAGCSLREAIATVNGEGDGDCPSASPSGNTIVLGARTYPLTLEFFTFLGGPPPGCLSTSEPRPSNNSWGELSVAGTVKNLTIEGAGSAQTVLEACKLGDRALQVAPEASVTLKGVTIANTNAKDGKPGAAGVADGSEGGAGEPGSEGGAILNEGTLTLDDDVITASHAGSGGRGGAGGPLGGGGGVGGDGGSGGAIASTGSLTVRESTITENSAGAGGEGGEATVGSTADGQSGNGGSGNSGGNGGGGGGIASYEGTTTIESSTIQGNTAGGAGAGSSGRNSDPSQGNGGSGGGGGDGGNGGGIAASGSFLIKGVLQATNDTIQGNTAGAGANGGNAGAAADDIFLNGTAGSGGDGGYGGGFASLFGATSQLVNLTIAENAAGAAGTGGLEVESHKPATDGSAGRGGGVYGSAPAPPTLDDTILYKNETGGDCRGSIVDGGHNLVFSPPAIGGLVTEPCNLLGFIGEDPKLASLAENGGPTATMRLLTGSPAIDQVPASGAHCPATDQRGVRRPGATACDIGAYEAAPPAISNVGSSGVSAVAARLAATVTANGPSASVEFQYGTSTAYGSTTPPQTAGGVAPEAFTAMLSALEPGRTYHFRALAASADGTTFGADQTFTTATLPLGAPLISGARETNHRWRDGTRMASISGRHARVPVGTTFSFTLNEAASVSFAFTQQVGGRRSKGRCVAARSRNHRGHRCKRTVTRGKLALAATVGANRLLFQGRISRTLKLAPGSYTVVITATNAAGQRSAPVRLSFTVVSSGRGR